MNSLMVNEKRVHGHAFRGCVTRTYKSWCAMIQRCHNKNRDVYPLYGGRGIQVCDRWRDYSNFLADMGERPEGATLDRIDNNGDYTPQNCRWADHKTQTRNSRASTPITYQGKTQTLTEWAQEIGISPKTLSSRLNYCGMSVSDAMTRKRHGKPRNYRKTK